jgi:hypothetical protein
MTKPLVDTQTGRVYNYVNYIQYTYISIQYTRGADKSLARTGSKQATVNKLGIYSTYVPQSSIHFLALYSNFCKPLKKNSEGCPSNQVSTAAMTSVSDEK